jgi:aryl-alcohol dehydrogenase-like predicted oxidoreductase
VHSATLDTGVLEDPELHKALAGLRDRGIRVGISTSGPAQADAVRRALEVQVGGAPLFTSIQSTWNLLEPSVGPALAEAAARGAWVIVKEAVANGRLAPGEPDTSPRAAKFADRLGVPLDQLAIAAALAQPWAWCVLSGAVDPAQVASNAAATAVQLPPDVLAELAGLAEEPPAYWSARGTRAWS